MTDSGWKVPFGRDTNGAWKTVYDVRRGKAAGLTCVGCGEPLIARHGKVKVWHLAHDNRGGGSGGSDACVETAEHEFVKSLIHGMTVGKRKHIKLPGMGRGMYFLPSQPAKLEVILNQSVMSTWRRPDIALRGQIVNKFVPYKFRDRYPNGMKIGNENVPMVIEVSATHKKDAAYTADMKAVGVSVLEMDVGSFIADPDRMGTVDFDSANGLEEYKKRIEVWVKTRSDYKKWLVQLPPFDSVSLGYARCECRSVYEIRRRHYRQCYTCYSGGLERSEVTEED